MRTRSSAFFLPLELRQHVLVADHLGEVEFVRLGLFYLGDGHGTGVAVHVAEVIDVNSASMLDRIAALFATRHSHERLVNRHVGKAGDRPHGTRETERIDEDSDEVLARRQPAHVQEARLQPVPLKNPLAVGAEAQGPVLIEIERLS